MDEIDRRIIEILKRNGRATYTNIGEEIGLSEGAVRKRVKALVDSGVITHFTVKVGFTEVSEAITLISIDPSFPTSKISQTLRALPYVEIVYEITGQHDIAVMISAMNIAKVDECVETIRRMDGIVNTNTMIILRSW